MAISGRGIKSAYVKERERKYKEKFSECGKFMKCLKCLDYKSLDNFSGKHTRCKKCNNKDQKKMAKKRNAPLW